MKNAKIFGSGVSRRTFGLHQHVLKVLKLKQTNLLEKFTLKENGK